MIRPLADVEKETILAALVECDFDVEQTAKALETSTKTVERRLVEWQLPAVNGAQIGRMKWSEYVKRTKLVVAALAEVRAKSLETKEIDETSVTDLHVTAPSFQ